MTAYITKDYVNTFLSEAQVTALLSYGEKTSTTDQNNKINLLIEAASSVIDSFLVPAGYDLPLATVPPVIQKVCFYLVVNDLYATAQQPIPETFANEVTNQYAILNSLKDGKMILDGLSQNTNTGTGGSTFEFSTTEDSQEKRLFSMKNLRGTFI